MTDLDLEDLSSRERADYAMQYCRRIREELDDVVGELLDLQQRYEDVQTHARRLKDELHDWCDLAERTVLMAALEQRPDEEMVNAIRLREDFAQTGGE